MKLRNQIGARKHIEKAMREGEERFRRFAVASGYGFAMGELNGQLVFANAATLRIVEEETEEAFTSKTFYQYYTPKDAERLRNEILPIVLERGQWVGECPLLSARGNLIDTEQNIFLIRDEQGTPRMVGNIITDITERKRAEEGVRRYEHIVASSTDMLALLDTQYVYLAANAAYADAFQKRQDQLIGHAVAEVFGKDFFDRTIRPNAERCLAGEEVHYQAWFEFPAHGRRHMDISYFPYVHENSDVKGFAVHGRDITERKQAEEALKAERDRLQALMDGLSTTGIGVDVVGIDYQVLAQNKVLTDKFGEPSGAPCHKYYMQLEEPCDFCPMNRALASGQVESVELTAADGKHYELLSAPFANPDGSIDKAIEVVVDITDRKQAEERRLELEVQLRQSQKLEAVGQLAGGVAHDFNNMLTAILGNVELSMCSVQSELGTDHRVVESMEQIEKAARRASTLTRQLLTLSRRQVIQPKVVSLNNILTDLEKMLQRLITENVALDIITDPELKSVHADSGQIEQVVVNLVVNAVHAMPDGGRLALETRNVAFDEEYTNSHADAQPGPHVLLAVSDTGHGMDAATCERIFEPFFTTKTVDKGSGLGLATVHGIVKQAGGHIEAYSEVGCGTTFKVYLPTHEAAPADQSPISPADPVPGGSETVLLCEDDRPVRELVAQSLRTAGYTVITAGNGQEGIEAAQSHGGSIDLLITDLIMPDMNGRALSERLRTILPEASTLSISGYSSGVIAHHGVLEEGVEFLEKPFTRQQLLTKVRTVIGKARAGV
ncbi:MAG: PAS domain-containing protein [Phycisphaerales bacterium]|nr:MAG: PAS domain-containing protein [Phycisphaerales bacterium]